MLLARCEMVDDTSDDSSTPEVAVSHLSVAYQSLLLALVLSIHTTSQSLAGLITFAVEPSATLGAIIGG